MTTAIIATNTKVTIRQLVSLEILPNSKRIMENRYLVSFDTASSDFVKSYLSSQVAKGRIASFKISPQNT